MSVFALVGTRHAERSGDGAPRSSVLLLSSSSRSRWERASSVTHPRRRRTTAAAASRHREAPLRQRQGARGRCRSRFAAFTSPVHWPRCPESSASTSAYKSYGLNTIELDVKDESGEIGFTPCGRASRARGRRHTAVLQPEGARRPRAPERHLHDRTGRLLPGSRRLRARRPGSRGPAARRERLDDLGGPRLGQPVRPSRLGLLRLDRRGGREGRVRPDHVRLRAIPVGRRRRRARSIRAGRASRRGA